MYMRMRTAVAIHASVYAFSVDKIEKVVNKAENISVAAPSYGIS